MAATGNEIPLLSQLKSLKDWVVSKLNGKMDNPDQIPHPGNIVMYQMPGTGVAPIIWTDPTISIPTATSSSSGLMSRFDKQKLDSLSASSVDIVKVSTHSTAYSRDTLEIVVDGSGKVTGMYFITPE